MSRFAQLSVLLHLAYPPLVHDSKGLVIQATKGYTVCGEDTGM